MNNETNLTENTSVIEEGAETDLEKVTPEEIKTDARPKRRRIWEIDFLRGLCVLLMVFDHIMYDFANIFGNRGGIWYSAAGYKGSAAERIAVFALEYMKSPARDAVQPIIAGIFIFLSGISSGFSRSNLKRGLRLAVFALLLSLATSILDGFIKGTMIRFGVLHMLAVSMILFGLIELALKYLDADKKFKYTSLIVYAALGLTLFLIGAPYFTNPADGGGLTPYLVYAKNFYSADYFPVLPWMGLMFLGAVFGRTVYKNKKSVFGDANIEKWTKPVNAIGRSSIWIYLLHQIVVFMILYLLGLIAGFGGL